MFRQELLENRKMLWRGRALLLPGIPPLLVISVCIIFLTVFITFVI
ncbi:colicin V secretion protein CvaA, partial [Salmonella enterica]|nr:colicin V secretion protein CvaA [Salmonella enterica]EAY8174083.1 colicin V secretion protein CvaA [Salmonella enterica]